MNAWLLVIMIREYAINYILTRVSVCPDTGCWLWRRGGDGRYGHAYLFGRRFKAHILSYLVFVGHVEKGKVLSHKCDTPACCNPDHLRKTSQAGNVHEMWKRGRGRSPFQRETSP